MEMRKDNNYLRPGYMFMFSSGFVCLLDKEHISNKSMGGIRLNFLEINLI